MKKLTLLLIILSLNVFSQKNKEEYALPHIVTAGVGYGAAWVIWKDSEANSNGSITEKRTTTPVFSASYEQIVKKKIRDWSFGSWCTCWLSICYLELDY